ncbi:MAG: DUF1049 domain-containing protein, partial [Nitrospirae bacterium]|nr:DUF1049 domain-containing protein [Nitrospirota bacterium]
MIRALISLVVLFIVFVFLVNNKDAVISIQYFPGGSAKMIPLYLFVLGTFLLGFVLSVVMMIPSWLRLKLETRRQRKDPLCGIPYHALNSYLSKLIKAGHQVALCEQMEDPRFVKGIVKREVVRVISPGTLVESELLEGPGNNYFASISIHPKVSAFAYIDISTGDFSCATLDGDFAISDLCSELDSLVPRELLVPEGTFSDPRLKSIELNPKWKIHLLPRESFASDNNIFALQKHFRNSDFSRFQREDQKAALSAAGALFTYLMAMVKTPLSHVTELKWIRPEHYMVMDFSTHRSLELTQNSYNGKREHSLLSVLDKTETSMGGRKLRKWIYRPLIQPEEIVKREDAVEFFFTGFETSQRLRGNLKTIHDLERMISRISLNSCNGRDLIALKNSLAPLSSIPQHFKTPLPSLLETLLEKWDNLDDVFHWIDASIVEDPPLSIKDGALIKRGYSSELDDLKSLGFNLKSTLANLETEEREKTGIDSLKIRYNQVAGYYIEVS